MTNPSSRSNEGGASTTQGVLWESVLRRSLESGDAERLAAAIGLAESGGAGTEAVALARGRLQRLVEVALEAALVTEDIPAIVAALDRAEEYCVAPSEKLHDARRHYKRIVRGLKSQHDDDVSTAATSETATSAGCSRSYSSSYCGDLPLRPDEGAHLSLDVVSSSNSPASTTEVRSPGGSDPELGASRRWRQPHSGGFAPALPQSCGPAPTVVGRAACSAHSASVGMHTRGPPPRELQRREECSLQ